MPKIVLLLMLFPFLVHADNQVSDVESNIRLMDSDKDGQVSVSEMRAYLERIHGKGYQQVLLDDMETKAGLKSCGSPFSKSLY